MFTTGGDKKVGQIVVYDPLERKLWCEDKKTFKKEFENHVRVPIHGTECKVSVFMELPNSRNAPSGPNPNEKTIASRRPSSAATNNNTAKVFIADLDLTRLGKWVKKQRSKKRMQHIYVIGKNPVGFGPVPEGECCDSE